MDYYKFSEEELVDWQERVAPAVGSVKYSLLREDTVYYFVNQLGIKPLPWQVKILDMLDSGDKRVIICTPRQVGKSLLLSGFSLKAMDLNLFPSGVSKKTKIGIISKTEQQSMKIISDIKEYIKMGDLHVEKITGGKVKKYFSSKVDRSQSASNNKSQITFQNGCSIISLPPTGKIKGYSFSYLFIDEAAHIPDPDTYYIDAEPTVSATNGTIVLTSTPNGRCYDDKTEVYTENGWKRFCDVEKDELVYSRNPDTGIAELVKPIDYIQEYYSGEMYKIKSNNIDLVVTPNHRMIGYNQKSKKRTVITVEKLFNKKTDFWVDKGFNNRIEEINKIVIPSISYNTGNGLHVKTEKEITNVNGFYKWLGYVLSDGHFSNGVVGFTQNNNSFLKEYIDLSKELFPWINIRVVDHYNAKRVILQNKQLFEYCKDFKKEGIPNYLLHVQTELLEELWQGLWNGDGSRAENRPRIYNDVKYKKLNDSVWYVAQRTGGSAKISNYHKDGITHITRSMFNRAKIKTYSDQIEKIDYDGMIYCLTVKYGELFVRRNGRALWCGNSGFYYDIFDPFDDQEQHEYKRFWLHYSELHNQEMIDRILDKKQQYYARGQEKRFEQEYEAKFTVQASAFFDNDDVNNMFDDSLKLDYFDKPCDLSVDFGMVNSHTVITICHIDDDGVVHRVYHYRYDFGKDDNLLDDIESLMERFNVKRIIPDDCPEGYNWIQEMNKRGWNVKPMSFRRDKVKKYFAFRSFLRQKRIKCYKDKALENEMFALQEEETVRSTKIYKPHGGTDDMIDSFVMACYFYLEPVQKKTRFIDLWEEEDEDED